MIRKISTSAVIILALSVFCASGCSQSDRQLEQTNTADFSAVDSLLGDFYNIPDTDKRFRPPNGFYAASDTVLDMLRRQLEQASGGQEGVEMVQCYLDTIHTAGLMVSTIEGINFKVDTTGFLDRYRQKMYQLFGQDNISEDDFWLGGILTKRFFVAGSIIVRIQLLCLSNDGNAAELIYFIPREQYPDLVKYFNASIGSVERFNQ